MPIVTRHSLLTVTVLAIASLLILGLFVWSGIYNIGADDTHTRPMYTLMQTMRERSITARANELHPPPNLNDPVLIRQGAGNYSAMCTGCHLAPGMAETELSKGLYPAPPNLTRKTVDAAKAFWVIKHGIKASGMPAWGKSMSDEYIWNMAAFLQQLPKLNAQQYQAMVDSSGGHGHGGGETMPAGGSGAMASMPGMSTGESKPHVDAPGAHDGKPVAGAGKTHVDPPGTPAHEDKPAAVESKPHADPPGAAPHGH